MKKEKTIAQSDFLLDQCHNIGTSDLAVLLGVECVGIFCEVLLNAVAERDAQLGGEVYLADAAADGLANGLVRYTGCTVQYQRDGNQLADGAQTVKVQLGHALVQTVSRADGNCQRVDTGALNELLGLLGIGERVAVAAFQIVFLAANLAELSLNRNTGGCAGVGNAAGEGDVVLKGVVRAVDHDGGVAGAQCLHSQLEAVAVIEVHGNRNGCTLCGSLGHGKVVVQTGVLDGGRGGLHDDRRAAFLSRLHDCHHHLHVFYVECTDRIVTGLRTQEHFFGCNQWHNK